MSEFIKLNNGVKMPLLGLGTSQASDTDVQKAVEYAIDVGYRHIDCAMIYRNEQAVGRAIQRKIADGSVTRNDLFVTSKLWSSYQAPEYVMEGLEECLCNLQLDYIDLFLIHWPCAMKYVGNKLGPPITFDETIDYVDTWKAFEGLYTSGRTKAIGVSNFNISQLERVLACAKIPPAVNQIECHPYLDQEEMLNFCKARDILVTAYSPFASPERPWVKDAGVNVFENEILLQISTKHQKSVAQVVLRYILQLGMCVIPKSIKPERIKSNLQVFDFVLDGDDMLRIKALNCNRRIIPPLRFNLHTHKYFPFPVNGLM